MLSEHVLDVAEAADGAPHDGGQRAVAEQIALGGGCGGRGRRRSVSGGCGWGSRSRGPSTSPTGVRMGGGLEWMRVPIHHGWMWVGVGVFGLSPPHFSSPPPLPGGVRPTRLPDADSGQTDVAHHEGRVG